MKLKKRDIPFIITSALLLVYVSIKAYSSSFTHDESFSYLFYPHDSFMNILSYAKSYTNNHILNTLLMKYSEMLFGNSEFALRLPNLLALLLFLIFLYKLNQSLSYIGLGFFILLITSPLLVDLFVLARGYGLSYAFLLMSLYYSNKLINKPSIESCVLFHFASLLSVLSHFTLLTVYVSQLLIHLFFYKKYIISKKHILAHALSMVLVIGVLYEPVRRVIKFNKMDAGGVNGFYQDTVHHIVTNLMHHASMSNAVMLLFQISLTALLLYSLFISAYKLFKKNREVISPDIRFLFLLSAQVLVISVIIILQHYLLDVYYPIGRFSVFLQILIVLTIAHLAHHLSTSKRRVALLLVGLLAVISIISFTDQLNIKYNAEWRYDANTKKAVTLIEEDINNESDKKVQVGCNWIFEPTINFYRETKQIKAMIPVTREAPSEKHDYLYVNRNQAYKQEQYTVLAVFDDTNTILLKRE